MNSFKIALLAMATTACFAGIAQAKALAHKGLRAFVISGNMGVADAEARFALPAAEVERLVAGTKGTGDPDTVVLVEDGRLYSHSSAALRIMSHLRWPWRWGRALVVVPRPLRDLVYRWIARNRYRWFGKAESCRVPTPELRARFL